MDEYNQLRDEFELKDEENSNLQARVYDLELMLKDSEIRLTIANELYQKEKMEKENTTLAFKRILSKFQNESSYFLSQNFALDRPTSIIN